MNSPLNPIDAVTHPDPYSFYAALLAERPIYRDPALGLWVASSADAVASVLTSDACRVRPPREPVPTALLGSPAADIFRHLVRMNDGAGHCPFNQAVAATLAAVAASRAQREAERWARQLADAVKDDHGLTDFAFDLSVYVVGSLLGIPLDRLPDVAGWMGDFVRCLSPVSSPEQIAQGKLAAGRLIELFRTLLARAPAGLAHAPDGDALLPALAREARRVGRDDADVIIANGIGFLSQAYEATAGLIGNTLVLLATHAERRAHAAGRSDALAAIVAEIVRWDPPVQNTRRFLARDASVAGQAMKEGEAILVVLAAANRDHRANAEPARFDPRRAHRRSFTFGAGPHACPGEALAASIARAGIAALLARGLAPSAMTKPPRYRPSANTRIPVFMS